MSSQSINNKTLQNTCEKLDDFLTDEGIKFLNQVKFDTLDCVNFPKIHVLNILKESMDTSQNCNEVLNVINKKLVK